MRGDLLPAWTDMWPHVWLKLHRKATCHPDLFCELYRELNKALASPGGEDVVTAIANDLAQSRRHFRRTRSGDLGGEAKVIAFLEGAFGVLTDLGGDALANNYYALLDGFLKKFSLRHDLRRPCSLCPTLPGIFAGVVIQLRAIANADVHLHGLLNDFESSIRDLKQDRSESKIKTCISKQMNVMEALGKKCPAVAGNTLGAICDQVGTWPHAKLGDALKNLYGFSCDYPGIRHGGTARNAVRAIELRDLIGVSIALAGLSRYITSGFDGERVYLEP